MKYIFFRYGALFAMGCGIISLPCRGYGVRATDTPRGSFADTTWLSTISTDTGDFAPGDQQFTTYDDPIKCLSATQYAVNKVRRTIGWQLDQEVLNLTPLLDTLPSEAVATARTCGRRFTATDTLFTGGYGAAHRKAWFMLSLWAMNDSLANAIVTGLLNNYSGGRPVATDSVRIVLWAIDAYLKATPARLVAARSLTARLGVQGFDLRKGSVLAHRRLLEFATGVFDHQLMVSEAEKIIELIKGFTAADWLREGATQQEGGLAFQLAAAYRSILTVTAFDFPDSLPTVVERLREVYRTPTVQSWVKSCKDSAGVTYQGCAGVWWTPNMENDVSKLGTEDILDRFLPDNFKTTLLAQNKLDARWRSLPPLAGQFWSPAPGRDTVFPAPGKVSLVVFLPTDERKFGESNWSIGYQVMNAKIRRWIALYGSSGLSVTVIASPHGHVLGAGSETPAQLGKSLAWYYHEYLRLPVAVAIDTAPIIRQIAEPDARVFYGPSNLEKSWGLFKENADQTQNLWYRTDYSWIAVVNRSGRTIWKDYGIPLNTYDREATRLPVVEELLKREFSGGARVQSTHPTGTNEEPVHN